MYYSYPLSGTYHRECISEKFPAKTFTAPRLQNYAEEVGHVTRANNYGNSVRHRWDARRAQDEAP